MAARAIWKAVIRVGELETPVKLYSAVVDRGVHFHLVHDQDLIRLEQRLVNPQTNEAVAYADAARGYQVERGLFVTLDTEELQALQPEPSREILVTHAVAAGELDHQWYVRPYWLGPDGDDQSYFALAEALAEKEQVAIAHWVMRKKSYAGALRVQDGYLMLVTLRSADEVISADELESPGGRKLSEAERKLAGQLIGALADDFDPADYRDEYRDRVIELIQTKREGGKIELKQFHPRKAADADSLVDSLRSSLKAVSA
jgi:DNA end-binding protein Ku